MAFKTSQSASQTTTTSIDSSGKQRASSTITETISRRKLSRSEQAEGILGRIGQLQMIGITILVLGVGSAVDDFTISDLQETNPNYQTSNQYIGYTDPLNEINYVQYGDGVFNRFFGPSGFITTLGEIGDIGKNVVGCLSDIPQCIVNANELSNVYEDDINNPQLGSFIEEFGKDRFILLSTLASQKQTTYYIYNQMTTDERQYLLDNTEYSLAEKSLFLNYKPFVFYILGFENPYTETWQWGAYTWPSLRQNVIELGV